MQKLKRIAALSGAILLIGMYLATLYLGLTASPASRGMLMASVACTVIVPCLLYAMVLTARVLDNRHKRKQETDSTGKDSERKTE